MAAFRRRGLSVAPFKVGPDFIDPGHHTHVVGRSSRNLDGWMLSRTYNQENFQRHAAGCDVAIVEGVMGLHDGFSGSSDDGSTAQMAKWLNLPVLLVVNAASMARSAAALVQGFEKFDSGVDFAGVVFNNLGSKGHLTYLKDAMDAYVDMPLLGGMLRDDALRMPERHLGLTTAQDNPLSSEQMDLLAHRVENGLDLDRLLEQLPKIRFNGGRQLCDDISETSRVRVGVAQDRAFCFYYPENLEILAGVGVDWVPFSPLADEKLPDGLGGIYFGGGYPELFARELSDNRKMRDQIRQFSHEGMPIYGECGGFMYLCRELEVGKGETYAMCGCFPFSTRMHGRLRSLGYRKVRITSRSVLGHPGQELRGHEFHYSDLTQSPSVHTVDTVYEVAARKGGEDRAEGYRVHQTLGSYIHLHFGSQPESALTFAAACRKHLNHMEAGHETP
jgi:cobyrinic acid a,c-diamide synthase